MKFQGRLIIDFKYEMVCRDSRNFWRKLKAYLVEYLFQFLAIGEIAIVERYLRSGDPFDPRQGRWLAGLAGDAVGEVVDRDDVVARPKKLHDAVATYVASTTGHENRFEPRHRRLFSFSRWSRRRLYDDYRPCSWRCCREEIKRRKMMNPRLYL